jgi:DNA polymerase III delta subunit
MDAARRFAPAYLEAAATQIVLTDYRMKTSFDDPQRLLELLILQLAQEGHND